MDAQFEKDIDNRSFKHIWRFNKVLSVEVWCTEYVWVTDSSYSKEV